MIITIKGVPVDKMDEFKDKLFHERKTTSQHLLASRLDYKLVYDVLLEKHYVTNGTTTIPLTTSEKSIALNRAATECTITGDGSGVAFLIEPEIVEFHDKVNKATCRIFLLDKETKSNFSINQTIKLQSFNYKQILLTDNCSHLFALCKKDENAVIEIYEQKEKTYKYLKTITLNSPDIIASMFYIARSSNAYHVIDKIGLVGDGVCIGDRLAVVIKERYLPGSVRQDTCGVVMLDLKMTVSTKPPGIRYDSYCIKPNYFIDLGFANNTEYNFIADNVMAINKTKSLNVDSVYIVDSNLQIVRSLSASDLKQLPENTTVVNIHPFNIDASESMFTLIM